MEDQIDSVSIGDKFLVKNAFATKFREKLKLTVPRSGKIEVLKKTKLNYEENFCSSFNFHFFS